MTSPAVHEKSPLVVRIGVRTSTVTVLAAIGEIDSSNHAELQRRVVELLPREGGHVVLDLSEVTFLDSAGVRALLQCRGAAERRGARLEIGRAHEHVRQVLMICGLAEVFQLTAR